MGPPHVRFYMTVPTSPLDYIATRMAEFFSPSAPWNRRLWGVGSTLALDEVVESARHSLDGRVKPRALQEIRLQTRNTHCDDPGLGDPDFRRALSTALGRGLDKRDEIDRLEHLVRRANDGYLERWRSHAVDSSSVELERAARSIASHLLDAELSPNRLRGWLSNLRPQFSGVADLLDSASEQIAQPARTYEVMIPFARIPGAPAVVPAGWMTAQDVSRWLADRNHKALQQVGGFSSHLVARDPWAAVEKAAELVDRIQARLTIGVPGRPAVLEPVGTGYVSGKSRRYTLPTARRDVEVHSLSRQDLVYRLESHHSQREIDLALELLAPMQEGVGAVGLAGGWATIEALFKGTDGAHSAASRAATIVACSWPRAELTRLAYAYQDQFGDTTAAELSSTTRNLDRCKILASRLQAGPAPSFSDASDRCSADRMGQLLQDPRQTLDRVSKYLSGTFQMLYRQRNFLLHSGGLRTAVLPATVRTAPSLVGAAVDRAVHAAEAEGLSSSGLVARAQEEIALVGSDGGRHVAALLEPTTER